MLGTTETTASKPETPPKEGLKSKKLGHHVSAIDTEHQPSPPPHEGDRKTPHTEATTAPGSSKGKSRVLRASELSIDSSSASSSSSCVKNPKPPINLNFR